jgi:hypothetical protein
LNIITLCLSMFITFNIGYHKYVQFGLGYWQTALFLCSDFKLLETMAPAILFILNFKKTACIGTLFWQTLHSFKKISMASGSNEA